MIQESINLLKKEIPYKWKIQSFNNAGTKASCVAYIDARDVMDVLDTVVSPDFWQDSYTFVGDKLIAGIGIYSGSLKEWIWKYDTGVEGDYEKEKSIFSDAFKRAAVKWGVGRWLYDLDIKWVDVKDKKPVDINGNIIRDLTSHFNSKSEPVKKVEDRKEAVKNSTIPSPTFSTAPATKKDLLDALKDMDGNILRDEKNHTVCTVCGKVVDEAVEKYSLSKYGKVLCRVDQLKQTAFGGEK